MKWLYTNACSVRSKQEELEICMQSQGFDLTAVMEVCSDSLCDWNVVMKGYMLFRKHRPGKHSGGVALDVRQHLEYISVCLRVDDESVESLSVRITQQASKGDTVGGDCYRPPDEEKEVDEVF